jgi:hypothetical protein
MQRVQMQLHPTKTATLEETQRTQINDRKHDGMTLQQTNGIAKESHKAKQMCKAT